MDQPGLHGRHRNTDGEISRKHGNTLVSTLRKVYGQGFGEGFPAHTTLSEVRAETGERSLSQFHRDQLHHDHTSGKLEDKIARHEGTAVQDQAAANQEKIDKGAP